jgi:hypothetical protein
MKLHTIVLYSPFPFHRALDPSDPRSPPPVNPNDAGAPNPFSFAVLTDASADSAQSGFGPPRLDPLLSEPIGSHPTRTDPPEQTDRPSRQTEHMLTDPEMANMINSPRPESNPIRSPSPPHIPFRPEASRPVPTSPPSDDAPLRDPRDREARERGWGYWSTRPTSWTSHGGPG